MRARLAFIVVVMGAVCLQAAQQPKSSVAVPPGVPPPGAADAATIAEVMAFEKRCDDAAVKGDVAFLERALSSDFVMTHGDAWTSGGAPLKVDTKASWLASSRCRTSIAISTRSRSSCMATSPSPSGDTDTCRAPTRRIPAPATCTCGSSASMRSMEVSGSFCRTAR